MTVAAILIAGGIFFADDASAAKSSNRKARVQTPDEAIAADAQWYARDQGVSQEEAVRRLRIQSEMGGLIGRLRKTHKSRLAGIIVDHQPAYRVRVRLTGTAPVPQQEHILGGSRLTVVFETGAKATVEELVAAMTAHQAALLRIYPTMAGLGADERTSEIVVYVYAPSPDTAAAAKAKFHEALELLALPARLEITDAYPTH